MLKQILNRISGVDVFNKFCLKVGSKFFGPNYEFICKRLDVVIKKIAEQNGGFSEYFEAIGMTPEYMCILFEYC